MSAQAEVVVTQAHLDAARAAGACGTAKRYRPGTPIGEVSAEDLEWFEARCPGLAKAASAQAGGVPLWALGSGYGYGYGSGDGDGSGYGDGYGYGSGDGDGSGSGDGYGDGYGYGYGYGDGSGDGYGYGYGYGDGSGDG